MYGWNKQFDDLMFEAYSIAVSADFSTKTFQTHGNQS